MTNNAERWRLLLANAATELNAMRLARAEDHKACARLTARVKELEQLVRDAHVLMGRYAGGDHGVAAWRRHAVRSCGATFPTVPVGAPRDTRGAEEIAAEQHREVAARLAEGTRDETAARCWVCGVPIPAPGNRCQLHARVNSCPPGAGLKECDVAACWKHGDMP